VQKSIASLFFAYGIPTIWTLSGCAPLATPEATTQSHEMSNNDQYTIAENETALPNSPARFGSLHSPAYNSSNEEGA
jgi:starvation-inducible outer membrane lipoprotein